MKEWFADESFWADLYPFIFSERRFAEAEDEVEKVVKLAKPSGRSVLDMCCGPGRHSVVLAQKGFAVTGVDGMKFLLEKARARARRAGVKIEWVEQDAREFVREGAFDLVLNVYTSFGYFDNKQHDMVVLRNMFASLKPGGVCVIDVMGKERLAKILLPVTLDALPDGTMLVERHEIFDDWTRIRNEWILLRKGRAKSFKFHHTVYSGQELKDLMGRAGFADIRLYGNLDGEEYGANAQRLVAVGCKRR
jgi:SAM-dependent methyltransferase